MCTHFQWPSRWNAGLSLKWRAKMAAGKWLMTKEAGWGVLLLLLPPPPHHDPSVAVEAGRGCRKVY